MTENSKKKENHNITEEDKQKLYQKWLPKNIYIILAGALEFVRVDFFLNK